jgi:ureidoglycolate hydrolase
MVAEPLTPDAFAPFGTAVTRPSGAPDATGPGWSWWARTGALPPADYAIGYLALEPSATAFDWAEYHPDSEELIAPLAGDCLVYVAAPGEEPHDFRVFRVAAGEVVILDREVWHGAPLALTEPLTAMVALKHRPDTVMARFDRISITMEA